MELGTFNVVIDFCKRIAGDCNYCPFWTRGKYVQSKECYFNRLYPADWSEDEVLLTIERFEEDQTDKREAMEKGGRYENVNRDLYEW